MIKWDDSRGERYLSVECSQLKDGYNCPVGGANKDNMPG